MSDNEIQTTQPSMSIRKGIAIYCGCLISMVLLINMAINIHWFSGWIPLIGYFVFGFVLNRKVLRGLIEWHPVYNTLENVSSAKMSSLLLWPLSYANLFFQLIVTKVL